MKRVYGTPGTGPKGVGRSSVLLGDDCADRVQWVSNEHEAAGKRFSVTDGYRPDGVEADYWVDDSSKTSTGGFNQWYAIGQHKRRGAAYAAPVGSSDHAKTAPGTGAVDCDVDDLAFRHQKMNAVGMYQTDSSETWHFAIRRAPVDWWDRSKVAYPNSAPVDRPVPETKPRNKEIPTMFLATENDVPKNTAKTFLFTETKGAVHLKKTEQVAAWLTIFGALGIKGPGFEKSVELPWAAITHASESLQGK